MLLSLVLAGCARESLSQRNFDKIQIGMALSEVDAIMGCDPTKSDSRALAASGNLLRLLFETKKSTLAVSYIKDGKAIDLECDLREPYRVIAKKCKGL